MAAPDVKELVEQLHAGVDAVLVAVGGVASRTVDDERGESSWLLAPPRAGDLGRHGRRGRSTG